MERINPFSMALSISGFSAAKAQLKTAILHDGHLFKVNNNDVKQTSKLIWNVIVMVIYSVLLPGLIQLPGTDGVNFSGELSACKQSCRRTKQMCWGGITYKHRVEIHVCRTREQCR